MTNDFYVALISGWFVLLIFWSTIIIFVLIRKPPNSRLTNNFIFKSYLGFLILFLLIAIIRKSDSFF